VTSDVRCAIVYRATIAGGREAEVRLSLDPAAATLADAFARLSARFQGVDPRSIEIELREHAALSLERG
jgi:hypothetical protein